MSLGRKAIFAATLKVVPPTDSVLHSTAILAKLRTFGAVTYFRKIAPKQIRKTTSASYEVHFDQSRDLEKVYEQNHFEVDFIPNHPDPDGLDFYDVFGYSQRHYPPKKSFRCILSTANKHREHTVPTVTNSQLVRHAGSDALFESLYWSGAPEHLRQGLSFAPVDDMSQTGNQEHHEPSSETASSSKARKPLRPMDLYRETIVAGKSG